MRNLILCLALGAVASSAFALTNEDLAANTWIFIKTVRFPPSPDATTCPAATKSVKTERLISPKWP